MQRILALLLFLLVTPLLLVVLLLIWVIERDTPIFIQERLGKNKQLFTIYKLRTMKQGQVTFLGKFLRKTGMDEIPQLINIVLGQMKFVGPRPLTLNDIERLGWDQPEFESRWNVHPGITGMAQLSNVCSAEVSWQCDQRYIAQRSMQLDLQIILQSLLVPIVGKKAVKQFINKTTP